MVDGEGEGFILMESKVSRRWSWEIKSLSGVHGHDVYIDLAAAISIHLTSIR